jgi:hypothetical protein
MPDPLLISDCRAMGLVDDHARIPWLCVPRVDQPAVCAALLDPDRGGVLEPLMPGAEPAGQRHLEGTLVVQTDLRNDQGLVQVTDCVLIPPRGPVSASDPGVLIRQLHVLEGEVDAGFRIDLRYGFGRHLPRWLREGRKTRGYGPGITVEFQSEIPLRPSPLGLVGQARLPAGQRRLMALRWQDPKGVGTDLRKMIDDTAAWWRAWSAQAGGDPRAPVLRGLTYHPTGAVVRSATTSLGDPPADGRLCWLTDQRAAAAAYRSMGLEHEAGRVEAWIARAGEGPEVRGLGGEAPPAEMLMDHLARPVHVGAPSGEAAGNLPYLPALLAG